MARRRERGMRWMPSDCLAAERRVSAVNGTFAAVSDKILEVEAAAVAITIFVVAISRRLQPLGFKVFRGFRGFKEGPGSFEEPNWA